MSTTSVARLAFLAVALLVIACDKVAVIDLSASDPAPASGTLVTVRVKVSNVSQDTLSRVRVDVDIPNRAPIVTLYRDFVDLPPGGTAELTTSYVANVGMNVVTACVDPDNQLSETPDGRANNCRKLDLTRYAFQELDYQRAGRSGATFNDAVQAAPHTCARLGQVDSARSTDYGVGRPGIVFVADCPTYGSAFLIPIGTGGKADPSGFGFTLANGWTVDSVTLSFRTNREDKSDVHPTLAEAQGSSRPYEGFSFTTPATPGNGSPAMTAHVWAEPGGFVAVHALVVIKGPVGTDPYGPVTAPCFSGWDEDRALTVFACNTNADCTSGYTCRGTCCLRD